MSDEREDQPTPEEREEAASLAAALEGKVPGGKTPEDALAAAGLLRHARTAETSALAPERLERLAARVQPAVDARRPRRRWWLWLTPAALVPAAAMMTVLVSTKSAPPVRPALPDPPLALIEAQGRAVRGGATLAALDAQMRDYRTAFYAALAGREEGGGR